MESVIIRYEITRPDYVEANSTVAGKVSRRSGWDVAALWGAGALLLLLPFSSRNSDPHWIYPFIVLPFSLYLGYYGLLFLLPHMNARSFYKNTDLAGQTFTAEFSEEHVIVKGNHRSWIDQWPAFNLIRESDSLFVFFDGSTMFIFAKRYFSPEQVRVVQQLIKQCWTPVA